MLDLIQVVWLENKVRVRTVTSVFLCASRPCGRTGSRHAQNGFQLKMRLRRLEKRFWQKVIKANYEPEGPMRLGPKKKNEIYSILYYLTCSAKFMCFFTYKCSLE